nr:putative nuclease HARBI1 [Hydra vulgaris]
MAIKKKRDFNQLIILDLLSSRRRILRRLRLAKKNRKNSFFELVSLLEPNIRAITPDKKVAITLYYLKDSGTLNMTANTFGIAVCTTSAVIFEVCNAIVKYIGPRFVNLPKNKQQMREKISEFESKFGMIQAFGCVDGTHIPIVCPTNHSQDYFCYKQHYSLQVQAVCDYKGSYLDVECMWPGSVHDAKVFSNSSINTNLRSSRLPGTFQTITKNKIKVPCYLIGDPAYPLLPHCIKKYSTCKKNDEVIFNSIFEDYTQPYRMCFWST